MKYGRIKATVEFHLINFILLNSLSGRSGNIGLLGLPRHWFLDRVCTVTYTDTLIVDTDIFIF